MVLGDAIRRLLRRADLRLVDIGARGGAMPQLIVLAPFSHYYACEPDKEEADALPAKLRENAPWRDITVIPQGISSNEGSATLYITKQPGLSSLLKPNCEVVNRHYRGDEFQIDSTMSVPTISLDHAAEQYSFRDACFLKVDTQGTELDILQSGKRLLQQAVLGLYVEAEFHPFYTGQPLFSDVDSYLRSLDFSLFDLHRVLIRRAMRQDDLYSRRQVVWAHALYLKEPSQILHGNDGGTLMTASRLLALALAFEHYDLALELMTSEPSAMLFSKAYGRQVRHDMEELVRHRTKAILRMGKSPRSTRTNMAFAYKDREHICG